jgi:hypothetical protein
MNPQSIKNPLDRAKYREQYLSNLRLQSSNDQKNQNANMVFKQTGAPPSRPPDTRTTTEKAGDIEGMKVDLRSKLGQITDGVIASQIIGELNIDQIRFAIDKWATIEKDMKKQFSAGVPSSAFIAYLNRLIEKFQMTEGVENGLQQTRAIVMSNTQMLYGLPRPQLWNGLRQVLDIARRQMGIDIQPLLMAIRENEEVIPTQEQLGAIDALPADLRAELMVIGNRMRNNVASNLQVAEMIQEIQIGLANRDKRYTENALGNAIQQLALDDSVRDDYNDIIALIEDFRTQGREDPFAVEQGDNLLPQIELPESVLNPPPLVREESEYGKKEEAPATSKSIIQTYMEQPRQYSRQDWDKLGTRNKFDKAIFINAFLYRNRDDPFILRLTTKNRNTPYKYPDRLADSDRLTNADLDSLYESWWEQTDGGMRGEGIKGKMKGCGVVKEQKVVKRAKIDKPYRQSIAHLVDKPVEKVKPYTQFGRYFINKHRLEGEGIVAFRQPSGNTIPTLPSEKISKPLAKVVKTLVGKGIPSYEDIANLSKEDKHKLHHICKTCKVDSPAIPKMKGEGEQEDDRFNILKGEIIAGNDNPKLAKEFKVMLLKFMNEGRIPRRQANEILQELLALGH